MILNLNHKNLDIYEISRKFVNQCYKITLTFPPEERFNLIQQIRRAGLSVILNLAEGASRKSALERKRYYEVSRGSLIEIDAALHVSFDLNYINQEDIENLKPLMNSCFSILSKMIKTLSQ